MTVIYTRTVCERVYIVIIAPAAADYYIYMKAVCMRTCRYTNNLGQDDLEGHSFLFVNPEHGGITIQNNE